MDAVSRRYAKSVADEPSQYALWDHEANRADDPATTPDRLGSRSSRLRWWRCPVADDHRWRASPASIANSLAKGYSGCPACAGRQLSVTNSFAARHPDLVDTWDYELNGDLIPADVVGGSPEPVWWRCPNGPDHRWQRAPLVMARQAGTGQPGCPACAGKQASVTNSVATHPTLAGEWHPDRNDIEASEVVAGTSSKLWWRCTRNPSHEWQATGANRVRGRGCPHCKTSLRSILEVCLAFELRDFVADLDLADDKVVIDGVPVHVDLHLPAFRVAIEVDGRYRHGSEKQLERDTRKTQALVAAGYRVMRVREAPLKAITAADVVHDADADVKTVADALLARLLDLGWLDLDPDAVEEYLSEPDTRHHNDAVALLSAQRPGQRIRLPAPVIATVDQRWEVGIAALEQFVAREKHAAVPWEHLEHNSFEVDSSGSPSAPGPESEAGAATSRAYKLGKWVGAQRRRYARGTLRLDRAAQLEGLPGWQWDAVAAQWEAGFAALQVFLEREGHLQVPAHHHEPDGYPLGSWVRSHRRRGGRRTISDDQRRRLDALPGWTYDKPRDTSWERHYAAFAQHVAETGSTATSRGLRVDGVQVDAWSKTQRAQYLAGNLSPDRARRLEALPGWSWDPQGDAWEANFTAVSAHLAQPRGDTEAGDGPAAMPGVLRAWVAEQRARYAEGTLDPTRRTRLQALDGWVWSVHEDSWERHFNALCGFVAREGHARVPTGHEENGLPLSAWVIRHRQDHKSGKVRADRAERLQQLPGWAWDVLAARWDAHYDALCRFASREGHARVPTGHLEAADFETPTGDDRPLRLGQWVIAQRAQSKNGDLPAERIQRLEEVAGWVWDMHMYAWERGLETLRAFIAIHGHARVPPHHVHQGHNLGAWLASQRRNIALGQLPDERVAALRSLGAD